MARFYLPGVTAAPDISPAKGSMWAATPAISARRILSTTKQNTAMSTVNATTAAVAGVNNYGGLMWVSGALSAQTINGTFSAVCLVVDTLSYTGQSLQVTLRVVSSNGLTQRGVLYAGHTATLNYTLGTLGEELSGSYATRIIPTGTTLSSVTTQAGDRLVIEVGARGETGSGPRVGVRAKDLTAEADYPLTSGLTSSLCSWVELSQTLIWGGAGTAPAFDGWGMVM